MTDAMHLILIVEDDQAIQHILRMLFEANGFRRLIDVRWWRGMRVEGGEPARMPDPAEAKKLWPAIATSPGLELYGGVTADFNNARDLGPDELERLAQTGMLRVGPGGKAVAGLRDAWGRNLAVGFIAFRAIGRFSLDKTGGRSEERRPTRNSSLCLTCTKSA